MKKIIFIAAAILITFSCTVFAAKDFSRNVGAVVVGGAEYKTPEFYKFVKDKFDPKSGAKFEIGGDLQNKYQKFLLNRDLVGNTIPRRQDLIDFAAASGYGKILFVVVSDSSADHQNNSKSRQRDRVSVQVDCYLCSAGGVIDVATASEQSDSKTSDLRARRGAFKKCLEELAKTLNKSM